MRRSRGSDDSQAVPPEPELRPATPRQTVRAAGPAPIALSATDGLEEARAMSIMTALGRIQLTLDLLMRKADRLEERLAAVESSLEPGSQSLGRAPISSSLRQGSAGSATTSAATP